MNNNLLLSVVLIGLLSGCQDKSMSDLKSFVNDAFKDSKPDIEPLPVVVPFKGFAYSAEELNDPFANENIEPEDNTSGARPDENRPKDPLEEFPLDALRLVGTLSQKGKPWVIVKTTQGSALLAEVGDYMGENNGEIKRISTEERAVFLTETVLDASGRWITRDVKIIVDEQ